MALDKKRLETESKETLLYLLQVVEASRDACARQVERKNAELRRSMPLPKDREGVPISLGDVLILHGSPSNKRWVCTSVIYHRNSLPDISLVDVANSENVLVAVSPKDYYHADWSRAKKKREASVGRA